ncbi:MAG: hypothetical protein HY326_02520 [Chloroflexi bacterium]|nr:hypothetical protein [Chloroflexota bacterium]
MRQPMLWFRITLLMITLVGGLLVAMQPGIRTSGDLNWQSVQLIAAQIGHWLLFPLQAI